MTLFKSPYMTGGHFWEIVLEFIVVKLDIGFNILYGPDSNKQLYLDIKKIKTTKKNFLIPFICFEVVLIRYLDVSAMNFPTCCCENIYGQEKCNEKTKKKPNHHFYEGSTIISLQFET